jgi:Arc/MetJ-type ribon-helix-helix transcriptional regulator
MVRTIVQLTEEQKERLERLAAERGTSVSALVREAVDDLIDAPSREERRRRALAAIGKYRYRDGPAPIGREHDKYLAEDFAG